MQKRNRYHWLRVVIGGVFGAIVVVVLFHLFGSLFGPLYQSEDESARNFVTFLACLFLGIVSGALFAYKYTVK
ncbi:hypothetical protein [Vibrio harveyi]|jgi:H+/Cl- antiporter ClcA|uniref:Uncharacterized protein n=1 Tax=Vibrio harveyi TaxID=669 RepID=A0A8B3DCP0_VIBHA|nr:hypothetical protein [Vibrio harveyi]AWB02310.1 hypothetical protein CU052_24305 [Vibrio harveyi]EKO3815893.1 hypothetical protein [Vibrio harveyi]EKO3839079.1 hypothetical protein [Vibrio harveyi]EKO3854557.1 hypothetical protein [Vibrio harveyi]EKO3857689.1 hypothetical protein [Vibrio harveyi]